MALARAIAARGVVGGTRVALVPRTTCITDGPLREFHAMPRALLAPATMNRKYAIIEVYREAGECDVCERSVVATMCWKSCTVVRCTTSNTMVAVCLQMECAPPDVEQSLTPSRVPM